MFVEPGQKDGNGPADYRLLRAGVEVWANERPYTLWHAAVTDTGVVVGYAYEGGVTEGHEGGPEIGVGSTRTYAGLHAYIIGADGKQILRDLIKAQRSRNNEGTDSEAASGLLVDIENDRFVVQFHHGQFNNPPLWVSYGLSGGVKCGSFKVEVPKHEHYGRVWVRRTDFIPRTPLIAIHWSALSISGEGALRTAALSVVTLDGKEVWSQFFPGEYSSLGDGDWKRWQRYDRNRKQLTLAKSAFSFSSLSLSAKLSFSIAQNPETPLGWTVVQTATEADPQIASMPLTDVEESIDLEFLGYVELTGHQEEQFEVPYSRVRNFRIDAEGILGFVSPNRDGTVRFVRANPEGEILSNFNLDLPVQDEDYPPLIVPTSKDRWLIVFTSWYTDPYSKAWWLTPSTKELTPLPNFHSGRIIDLDLTGDGGFVAAAHAPEWNGDSCLIQRYDSRGTKLWELSVCHLGTWSPLQLIGIAWQEPGGVVALSRGYEALLVFVDPDGNLERSVPVTTIIEKDLGWPTGLSSDTGGGLIFNDMGAPPTFRINADDEVLDRTRPRFTDEQILKMTDDVQSAPDGTLWTSDSYALLRLDETGVVDRVIGRQGDAADVQTISCLAVASTGEIFVTHGAAWSVYIYNSQCELLRKCEPFEGPSDELSYFEFAQDPGVGAVRIRTSDSRRYKLSRDGALEELVLPEGLDPEATQLAKPGSDDWWVIEEERALVVDAAGVEKKAITRQPNGNWMKRIFKQSVAADGSDRGETNGASSACANALPLGLQRRSGSQHSTHSRT